jgi:DNA-binding NarL/FixJ family response regulator
VAAAEAIAGAVPDASPSASAAAQYDLTRRELEVLRLLVEGRSDREIAEALFISPKTVGTHVVNLLGKLGVPSRAAAIAYAHRHGLA